MIEITGKCLGIKTKTFDNTTTYVFGIGEPKLGGFKEEMQIHEIKISKELNTPHFLKQIEELEGKVVKAGCTLNRGEVEGNRYATFTTTGVLTEVGAKPAAAVKAA